MYPKSETRALDLCELKGHVLRVVQKMEGHLHDFPRGQGKPELDAYFIFCGYSWKEAEFKIWIMRYTPTIDEKTGKPSGIFRFQKASHSHGNIIAAIGDHVKEAKNAICALARSRQILPGVGFDMEPFEVLRDFCRDDTKPHIGGSPQILKIYKHMNSMPYGVYWPNKQSNERTLFGRPLIDYEMPNYMMLDPDTLTTEDYVPPPKKEKNQSSGD